MTTATCPARRAAGAHRHARLWAGLPALIVPAAAGLALAVCAPIAGATTRTSGPARERPRPSPPATRAAAARATAAAAQAPLPVAVDDRPASTRAGRCRQRFLGLSFEAAALDQLAQYADRGDLVEPAALAGARRAALRRHHRRSERRLDRPSTPRARRGRRARSAPRRCDAIGALARRSGWKVLLTVGLAHYEPRAAAREVAAAHRALGPYLAAVEIGNEPNAYGSHGFRALPWIAQGYEEEVSEYREAIAALTPGVPIAGPDVSGSGVFPEWGEEEALVAAAGPADRAPLPARMRADARRPRSKRCSAPPPADARRTRWRPTCGVARTGIPLRIDEANSVSCGGVAGISDTFASALWATGYITQAWRRERRGSTCRATRRTAPDTRPCARRSGGARAGGAARPARLVRAAADQIARRLPAPAHHGRRRRARR